jgi:DNA (cytosine-5)-methyltransferase 1
MEGFDHMGMRNARSGSTGSATRRPALQVQASQAHSDEIVDAKIRRLATHLDERPRVLDLFAGCGGLSLGFEAAGFEITAAMEIDELAALTHARSFCRSQDAEVLQLHAKPRDITAVDPDEIVSELGLGVAEMAFDLIIGGPPCQAYARVGRAKLREIAEHPQAFKVDPRANLYLRYLHYIERLKPLGLLMENVPDILNHGGHNIVQEMVEALDVMGYTARYTLMNSAHHGVPQMRDRVFMIAFRKELRASIEFPAATRHCALPQGYEGTRAVALKWVNLFSGSGYVEPDTGDPELPPAVTAKEAISDLPPILLHREGKLRRGARRFTELAKYRSIRFENLSSFAREMRTWPGFESDRGVYDHVLRYLPRDTLIFEAMSQGDEYPAAHRVANQLFEAEAMRRRIARGSKEWVSLHRAMVPPYDPGKFPNRWWKLKADRPARTLMAHIGKDTYSHIHYDSDQARVISVREAARLQSFPDGFTFAGTMNPAFRQIGNAVPPIMSRSLATAMMTSLNEALLPFTISLVAAE